jgi:hypothetical protein
MPVYVYECPQEHIIERFMPVVEHVREVQCSCGLTAVQRIMPCAVHTVATFSRTIDDRDVQRSIACDGSYLDPTLSFDPETNKVVAPITSEKQRQKLMEARGLVEKPPSDKAKDVQRLKRTKPLHFV